MTMWSKVRWIGATILLVLVVVLGFQNATPVTIWLLFEEVHIRGSLLFPGLFLLGSLAGLGWGYFLGRRSAESGSSRA